MITYRWVETPLMLLAPRISVALSLKIMTQNSDFDAQWELGDVPTATAIR
jgi:hypothetical protein